LIDKAALIGGLYNPGAEISALFIRYCLETLKPQVDKEISASWLEKCLCKLAIVGLNCYNIRLSDELSKDPEWVSALLPKPSFIMRSLTRHCSVRDYGAAPRHMNP